MTRPESVRALLMSSHTQLRCSARRAYVLGARPQLPAADVQQASLRCFEFFSRALPLHFRDEEDSVGPRLPKLNAILERVNSEHTAYERPLQAVLDTLSAVIGRPQHPTLRRQLAQAASALETAFEANLRFEEAELFPHIDALPAGTQQRILSELHARHGSPR